jgi:hypothetical protein
MVRNMESAITTGPILSPRADVLAEVAYIHSEEDFVALWMYWWEQAQNQRFHPLARRLDGWTRLTTLRAFAFALVLVTAFAMSGEKCMNYALGATAATICWVLVVGLVNWSLAGPKGFLYKLARWRYHRKMRGLAHQMAARKTEINLSRHHRVLLTVDSCIHLVDLHEIDQGSTLTERTEIVTSWAAFERIERTDQHAFLFERQGVTTLPRRAFSADAAFREFVDLARHLHQAAIHNPTPPLQWKRVDERITS